MVSTVWGKRSRQSRTRSTSIVSTSIFHSVQSLAQAVELRFGVVVVH
jgi:hypothetical protein